MRDHRELPGVTLTSEPRALRINPAFALPEAHSQPGAVFYRYFRSPGGTSVISRATRWKVT
jgi:hypothetical protein